MDLDARTTLLINQVLAWHNRHPLARRITRAQITGVGTVALPFVGPAPGGEGGSDSGPVSVLASSHAAQEAELSALEAELVAALGDAGSAQAPDAAAHPADLAGRGDAGRARGAAGARPAWHPATWWARLQALRPPKAGAAASARRPAKPVSAAASTWRVPVFSENFVPPLKPATVARWAHRHATLDLPGAVDGPLREVPVDSGLRRLAMRGRRAALQTRYLSSAAIEIDDSLRLRCLIGPFKPGERAAMLGPRAWDPRRLALAAGAVMLAASLAAGVAWHLRPAPAQGAAEVPLVAASAAPVSASASASAPAASAAAEAASAASAAGGHEGAGPLPEAAPAASAASGALAAVAPPASAAHAEAGAHPLPGDHGAAATVPASAAAAHVQTGTSDPEAPPLAAPAARSPLGLILSEEARREVREASEAARGAHAAQQAERQERRARAADPEHQPLPGLKPGKVVYALVAPARADKAAAELELARIKSGASLMPYSSSLRFEVLPSDGQWRATWYPFAEQGAAERTRLTLLKRGVPVELVEF